MRTRVSVELSTGRMLSSKEIHYQYPKFQSSANFSVEFVLESQIQALNLTSKPDYLICARMLARTADNPIGSIKVGCTFLQS